MKILLTGATGFIGSHIAKQLLEKGCEVYATYRSSSSFERCIEYKDKINWVNTDQPDWRSRIHDVKPDQLIHAAWAGIDSRSRNNWDIQLANFLLSKDYFDLAIACNVKKIIALGSQAEYGRHFYPVHEETLPKPDDAYGAIKILTGNYLRTLCENGTTEWYWIRVFSVFGEGENADWLIPSVISKLLKKEPVQLTSCEQSYNYLYVEVFVSRLLKIVACRENRSGIYNICHSNSVVLKDVLLQIADILKVPYNLLQFGALAQRPGQNAFIGGDNSKFMAGFRDEDGCTEDLTIGLLNTIKHSKEQIK